VALGAIQATLILLNIGLACYTIWEKRQAHRTRQLPAAHPLEPALRDVAAAIRERGPDFHLRLEEKPHV